MPAGLLDKDIPDLYYSVCNWTDLLPPFREEILSKLNSGENSGFLDAVINHQRRPEIAVAYAGTKPIAWVAYFGKEGDGYVKYITYFYTDESFRKHGITTKLFAKLFKHRRWWQKVRVYKFLAEEFFKKLRKQYPWIQIKWNAIVK